MRKNSPRKWLHAVLDLLPIILIPVFMIYSHRHDISETSSYVEEVPIYYETNDVNTLSDIALEHIYSWNNNYTPSYVPSIDRTLLYLDNNYLLDDFINNRVEVNDIHFVLSSYDGRLMLEWFRNGSLEYVNMNNRYLNFVPIQQGNNFNDITYVINSISSSNVLLIKEYTDVTYSYEKDVLGAFVSNFANSVNRYFNFNSALPFTEGVYNWLNTNLFGGNIPVLATAIWHIIVYEFIVDILFILYAFFMFLIDFTEMVLERPFDRINRR